MTSVPGLYSIGESNFSDHGANRLGASALMQGLADGYFVLPYTIGEFLSKDIRTERISTEDEHFIKAEKEARSRNETLLNIKGKKSVESLHRELGKIMWDNCGMSRNEKDLKNALIQIKDLKNDFWKIAFLGSGKPPRICGDPFLPNFGFYKILDFWKIAFLGSGKPPRTRAQ